MAERTPSGRMGQQVHDYKLKMPGRVAKAIKKGGPVYDTRDNNPHKQASDHLHAVAKKHGVKVKRFHRDMTGHYAHLHPNQDKGKVHAMLTDYEKTVGKAVKESATNMRNLKLINKIKKSGVVKQGSMKKEDITNRSADKKPEKYIGPDGKTKIRMVPVDKEIHKEGVDEVLDSPKTFNSYMRKNKTSARRAHNDRTFGRRSPEDNKRNDRILKNRDKGRDMADRARTRTFNKQIGHGYTNRPLGESFDHGIHQDHAYAHYNIAQDHEHSGSHEAAAHHYKASDHHDEAHAAHERGDHTVGAYHAKKAAEHASKAARAAMKHGGEHKNDSQLAYRDSKDTHDATPHSSGHSAASASKLTRESKQVDEILDTPKAMQSYRDKNKRSKEKAANSAAAKILRGKDKDGKRADHSPELNTMRKRRDGEKMADRLAGRKTLALVRKQGMKMRKEAYSEPQGQAKRMMSPLQKMRMDKEKADRDRDGKLKPGVTKKKEATIPPGKTIMTKKPDLTRNDADKLAKIRQMLDKEKKK